MHYLRYGANDGEEPGPLFRDDDIWRAIRMSRVGMNPLLHYELFGRADGALLPLATTRALDRLCVRAARAQKRRFSILYVSGEPTTPGNVFRVTNYVEAAKANGVYADWFAAEELASRLENVQDFDVLVIWRTPWDENARARGRSDACGRKDRRVRLR